MENYFIYKIVFYLILSTNGDQMVLIILYQIQKYKKILLDFIGHKFSGVHGYVWKHRFYGTIVVRNNVLFVEPIVSGNQIRFPYFVPSARALVKKKGSLNAYVYKIYSRNIKKTKHVSAELCEKESFCLSNFT